MSSLRFNHVFLFLMAAAFFCAFVLPPRFTDRARIQVGGLFVPVSAPARWAAQAVYARLSPEEAQDRRTRKDVSAENDELRQEIARLRADIGRLEKLEAEGQKLGDLKPLCTRVQVVGSDSGGRDTLVLAGSSLTGVKTDEPALYSGGVAGRVFAGAGGGRVRLLTDYGFSVTGSFIRFVDVNGQLVPTKIAAPTPLVQGLGRGQLVIRGMKLSDYQAAQLTEGDWVVLDDPEWPHAVQGMRLGRLTAARESRDAPGFVEIRLVPESNLMRLTDVWVLNRE